jgi:SAM-dependent methyltransferase
VVAKALPARSAIDKARAELKRRRLSCLSPFMGLRYAIRRLGIAGPIPVGYWVKSWDVLQSVEFVEAHLAQSARILDLGAFTSEMPCILHRLGYGDVTGIDLNPEVTKMPYAESIHYVVGDFTSSSLPANAFDCITAISTIEHGYDGDRLFVAADRLLRPGGYFIASFDYWPEKVDTTGIVMYGLDWRIFSQDEVHEMVALAQRHGFQPVGGFDLATSEHAFVAPIAGRRFEYTFAWMVLRKTNDGTESSA